MIPFKAIPNFTSNPCLYTDGIKAEHPTTPPPPRPASESSVKIFVKNVEKNALENLDKQSSSNSWL